MPGLTRKKLIQLTDAPAYTIDYLNSLGRLPVIKASTGKGSPNLYAPKAIEIVKEHMAKSNSEAVSQ